MFPPKNPNHKKSVTKINELQERAYLLALKAKGKEFCALVQVFDQLEIRKRILQKKPMVDTLAKVRSVPPEAIARKPKRNGPPFPEPTEATQTETGPDTKIDNQGISFGMEG